MPENLRNEEFETEINKHKDFLDSYKKDTTEIVDSYIKTFKLNWSVRNDFAKTIITVSSGILTVIATLSSNYFKSVPPLLLLITMVSFTATIGLNVAALWILIKSTLIRKHFLELQPIYIERVEKMLEHGRFEREFFDDISLIPFGKAYKNDVLAYRCLNYGIVTFSSSILLLLVVGSFAMPVFTPSSSKDSLNRSNVYSPQSFGSHTGAKGLKSK